MAAPTKKTDEQKFDDVLRRMLNTPPKPHEQKKAKAKQVKKRKSAK